MRRFSQRNSLVTLADINITPLLDLAFVLLIIFVITTPLLEKGLDVKLPSISAGSDTVIRKSDVRTVEVNPQGQYEYERQRMPLDQIMRYLAQAHRTNPRLVVDIRADKSGRIELLTDLLDRCQQLGITQMSVRGNPRTDTP
jgi:biopolymer transport protein ExbD